jgi:hypothetical protein
MVDVPAIVTPADDAASLGPRGGQRRSKGSKGSKGAKGAKGAKEVPLDFPARLSF